MTGPAHTFRYFVDQDLEQEVEVELGDEDARHLVRVVRARLGDRVELIDRTRARWPAQVTALTPRVVCRVSGPGAKPPLAAPIELRLCLPRKDTLDRTVRMVTELGVEQIVLLTSERIDPSASPAFSPARIARLSRIAHEAWIQSGVPQAPVLHGPVSFDSTLEHIASVAAATPCVILDPRADPSLTEVLDGAVSVILVVGPEAGFSDGEVASAEASGAIRANLGTPGVLRVDTAAVCATAIARSRLTRP